jgi:aminomethyltransferase
MSEDSGQRTGDESRTGLNLSAVVRPPSSMQLKRTPLHNLHVELGVRFAPFAGYEMPINYRDGVLKEHLHVRAAAGLFDVSHMGQLVVRSASQQIRQAALALEALVPIDVLDLPPGRQRYALFTNSAGGVVDDLMIANLGDRFMLVVNASRKEEDEAHLLSALTAGVLEHLHGRALLALQGPRAEAVLARFASEVTSMDFMDVRLVSILGEGCVVSRSGYTGEDGFEISISAGNAQTLARRLLDHPDVAPIGLGARDSLRLEAGLCLYGCDLDTSTTPVEAALEWAIQKSRRKGGAREGCFPGAHVILRQLTSGVQRRRVGLRSKERTPVRAGSQLYHDDQSKAPAGAVTSGGFGPSVNAPVAMGYVASAASKPGTTLFAEVRGRRVPVEVSPLPFVPLNYRHRK